MLARDHQTGSKPMFVFCCFCFSKLLYILRWIPKELITSVYTRETYVFLYKQRCCSNIKCEVEFFGRCCVRGRYIRLFFMWADSPLAYYQIADLEDVQFVKVQKRQASQYVMSFGGIDSRSLPYQPHQPIASRRVDLLVVS